MGMINEDYVCISEPKAIVVKLVPIRYKQENILFLMTRSTCIIFSTKSLTKAQCSGMRALERTK